MDMISNCPNSILSHILSFLPTKLAASTCVLSKRWQFLWTMVHNLDLNFSQDYLTGPTATSFVCFVNNFFILRDKDLCLKKFHLNLDASCISSTQVDSWVLAAMSCDLEELYLDFNLDDTFWFRCNIFNCKTLVVLKLGSDIVVDAPPSSIHFPSLKVLHLNCVEFKRDRSFCNLIFGCPILESLELRTSGFEEFNDFEISSPTFEEFNDFEISSPTFEEFNDFEISSPTLIELVVYLDSSETSAYLSVEAPSLKYLHVSLFGSGCIYLKNLDKLVQADIDLEIGVFKHSLEALCNVRGLKLGRSTFNDIHNICFEDFPVFQNLVQLKLDDFCSCWGKLLLLLQKIPYLQHLTLHLRRCCNEAWDDIDVPNCLFHLRTFSFYSEYGWDWDDSIDFFRYVMEFFTYVLKNSTVLENMTIVCKSFFGQEKCDDLRQKLASLDRGSNICILEYFQGEVL